MQNSKLRRDSSFTQFLSKISKEESETAWVDATSKKQSQFQFIVASSLATRKRAYRLSYDIYKEMGYVENDKRLMVTPFDGNNDTLTLLIKSSEGEDIGTIGLYIDKNNSLPSDESFKEEMKLIRMPNRKIAEVTRLALKPGFRKSKILITMMFNFIYLYAYKYLDCTDFIIEVKSSHANYYSKLLDFKTIGSEKPVKRVKNNPSKLLQLSLDRVAGQIPSLNNILDKKAKKNLYRYFYAPEKEQPIIDYLKAKSKPISEREKKYFGLIEKDFDDTEILFESDMCLAV